MKLVLTIDPCGLDRFYDTVAKEIGCDNANNYDCTKITVAKNIQDNFYEYYAHVAKQENDYATEHDVRVGITLLLAIYGPKVDDGLRSNEIEIFDGFIC